MDLLLQNCLTAGLSWLQWLLVYLVGYSFSVIGGNLAAGSVVERLPRNARGNVKDRHASTKLLGVFEAALYTTSWVIGKEGFFIPVWLVLKVSSHWGRLSFDQRRPIFNRWLIGTGLSLAYGIAGGVLITKATACASWPQAVMPAVLLAIATVGFAWYARQLTR